MRVSIEGGCTHLGEDIWSYRWDDNAGFHNINFRSVVKPKIGDEIVDGELVPLIGIKKNNDTSRWVASYEEEWPER